MKYIADRPLDEKERAALLPAIQRWEHHTEGLAIANDELQRLISLAQDFPEQRLNMSTLEWEKPAEGEG